MTPDTGAIAIPTTATSGATPASSYETASVSQTHVYWSHAYTEGACDAGSQRLYPWSKTTGVWKKAKHYCPEQQFFTATAAPWTVPQPGGGGSDCGCALFPSYNMLALNSSTDSHWSQAQPYGYHNCGTTSQYISQVSGTNTMLNLVVSQPCRSRCEIQRKHRFVSFSSTSISATKVRQRLWRMSHSRIPSLSPLQLINAHETSRLTSSYISLHSIASPVFAFYAQLSVQTIPFEPKE